MAQKRRVNVNMDSGVYEEVKNYADNFGISVSAAITLLSKQSLDQVKAFSVFPELMKVFNQLQEKAVIE